MPKIQVRRGTAAQWTTANPTLSAGEFGYETDTKKFKIGDGSTVWGSLSYAQSGALTATPYSLTISNAFSNSGTFNGSSAITLDLPSTIARNAQTATALQTGRTINGTTFDGSAAVIVGGAIYGQTASSGATFRNIYVSPSASAPTSPQPGDVWIAW
jgi:hypothetical protein